VYAARVLTSDQSIAFLEEKKEKRLEEEDDKKRKNEEKAMKKAAMEEEKRCKAVKRAAKKAEAQQKRKDQGTWKRPVQLTAKIGCKKQNVDNGKKDYSIKKFYTMNVLVFGKKMTPMNGYNAQTLTVVFGVMLTVLSYERYSQLSEVVVKIK